MLASTAASPAPSAPASRTCSSDSLLRRSRSSASISGRAASRNWASSVRNCSFSPSSRVVRVLNSCSRSMKPLSSENIAWLPLWRADLSTTGGSGVGTFIPPGAAWAACWSAGANAGTALRLGRVAGTFASVVFSGRRTAVALGLSSAITAISTTSGAISTSSGGISGPASISSTKSTISSSSAICSDSSASSPRASGASSSTSSKPSNSSIASPASSSASSIGSSSSTRSSSDNSMVPLKVTLGISSSAPSSNSSISSISSSSPSSCRDSKWPWSDSKALGSNAPRISPGAGGGRSASSSSSTSISRVCNSCRSSSASNGISSRSSFVPRWVNWAPLHSSAAAGSRSLPMRDWIT